jgi:hypothetical protein
MGLGVLEYLLYHAVRWLLAAITSLFAHEIHLSFLSLFTQREIKLYLHALHLT